VADEVLVEHDDRVAIITINRPHARNAINQAVSVAMAEALEELDERADLTVGIITGAGGTFSSGMDLKAFLAGENVRAEGKGLAGLTQAPPRKPLIAAVEGWALAGGCEIALACDLIVAANDAKFGIPEVKRGLVAGAGGLIRLPRRIPAGIAMELALTGDPLPSADAYRLGLVNAAVELLADEGSVLELRPQFAPGMLSALPIFPYEAAWSKRPLRSALAVRAPGRRDE